MIETHGRHDPCVGIRATPICEAMMALTLMDHALRHRAQNADVACDDAAHRGPGARRRDREAARRGSGRESRSRRGVATQLAVLPHRRLAGFYFFYFAYLGAFAPFFSLYLDGVGRSAVEIGVLMALPQVDAHRRAAPVGLARRRAAAASAARARDDRWRASIVLARRVRGQRLPLAVRGAAAA